MRSLVVLVCAAAVGLVILGGDKVSGNAFPALESHMDNLVAQTRSSGGFTIDPRDGTQPTQGVVVATGRVGSRVMPAATFFGGGGVPALRDYLSAHASELWANHARLVGSWYDRPRRRVVLSVVELVPERTTAIALGIAHQQTTVYDLASQSDIPTGYIPEQPGHRTARR